MTWKDAFSQGREIIFTTSSLTGRPNSVVVISQGFVDGKLLVAACQMGRTLKNLEENPLVCAVGIRKKEYYRINGRARLSASGKYFRAVVERNDGPGVPSVKKAIAVSVKEVYDLDKVRKIL